MTATEAARFGDAGVRATVCEALASLRFSGRTPVSETVIQVVKDFIKDWLQTTKGSLEQSVLPLLPDPAAREQVTGHFRSHLGWLDGLGTRKLEMAFLKAHLDTSLVLPLKRDLPIKKKKKRKLDSSEGAKEVNHCWDLCLLKQIQARIEHDSEFRRELLKSSERWSAPREEDVGKLEMAFLKRHLDNSLVLPQKRELPVKKKKRKLDSSGGAKEVDHCWDLCLIEQIQARIWHDSEFRHELLKSSERWSARAEDVGSLQESLDKLQGDAASAALADFDIENAMHDVEDGLLFRTHPKLGREGAIYACNEHGPEHHQVVKLCFIAYLDGIETANPLGVARGSHSEECVYVALLNLPLRMRYRMENLFPVTLCHTSTLKRFGTRAVIGGRGGGDDDFNEPRSLGAVMRKLDAGISLKFPSAEAGGGYEDRWCCGWQLLFLADFPAAGKVLPTAELVSAKMPCRGCTWRRSWTQRSQPCGSEQDDAFEDGASYLLPPLLRGEAVLGAAYNGPLPAGVFAGQGVPIAASQG